MRWGRVAERDNSFDESLAASCGQRDYKVRLASFAAERDAMERDFVARAYQAHHASLEERRALSEACFAEASEAHDR